MRMQRGDLSQRIRAAGRYREGSIFREGRQAIRVTDGVFACGLR